MYRSSSETKENAPHLFFYRGKRGSDPRWGAHCPRVGTGETMFQRKVKLYIVLYQAEIRRPTPDMAPGNKFTH